MGYDHSFKDLDASVVKNYLELKNDISYSNVKI